MYFIHFKRNFISYFKKFARTVMPRHGRRHEYSNSSHFTAKTRKLSKRSGIRMNKSKQRIRTWKNWFFINRE